MLFRGNEVPVPGPTAFTEPAFGTAHLMGRSGSREATRLIHFALDCGVTHFDTARVYGFGDAEAILGKALRRRPDVSIYSKVGQGRPHHSWFAAQIRTLARPAARTRARVAQIRGDSESAAIPFVRRTNFASSYVRASVETSLKMLRREVLDGLLLHEATTVDANDELFEVLAALVREGKIRRFGIASEREAVASFDFNHVGVSIIQQPAGPFSCPIRIDSRAEIIVHSVFGQRGKELREFLTWLGENKCHHDRLLNTVEQECADCIPALLMSYTATRWPISKIIFASGSERHIRENVSAIRREVSPEGLRSVAGVLSEFACRER
ncbi:aldo/keto reductase [Mycolicibacterium iranicum]|uniref:aldo/keto reductase n=1 Tax=Mycolicibacterium iranicum TaxID=912594 RepID=UPI0009DBAFCD|nr:aldo/keto reductase [Mycolicibacterium iranicum]